MVPSERLPPGFRFSPTNEELIMYYLKKKVLGEKIWDGVISELDIYKYVPWHLPNLACLQSRDLIWYFLCPRPERRGNSGSSRRVNESGYWKITGPGRPVKHKGRDVGEIKTLTYYKCPPGGSRIADVKTEWTMHEYRLVDQELNGVGQDSYVLSKIFEKRGPGPMNGAEYGAPFEEDEWKDDDDAKKETDRIVASLTEGPSAGSKNQQGPSAVTAGILLERTEGPSRQEGLGVTGITELIEGSSRSKNEDSAVTAGILSECTEVPSCSYNHQEGLALTGISELIEGPSRCKNQEYYAANGIFERGDYDRGLVFSSADPQVSHGYGDVSFMDLVMSYPNANENAIQVSERPQGQFPMIDYYDNAIASEQMSGLFDDNNDAVQVTEGPQGQSSAVTVCDAIGIDDLSDKCSDADMLVNGTGQVQFMQGADYNYDGQFGSPEDQFYRKACHSPGYIPEYLPAEWTYPDGNFLEEREIDGSNAGLNGYSFMNSPGYIPEYPVAEWTYPDGNFLEEKDIDGAYIWPNGYSFMNASGN